MSETCPTVKVMPWGKDQGEFVEINEADFDEAIHKAFADPLDHDGDGKKGGSKPAAEGYAAKTVLELKALAVDRGLDLGDATKKGDIIAAFELADEEPATPALTRTEIEADLTAMEVDFDPALDDDALLAQRNAARAVRDAE